MDVKFELIDEFMSISSINNADRLTRIIKRMDNYTKASNDEDIERISIALKANREDCLTSNYSKCCKIAAPLVGWLLSRDTFEELDIAVLGVVLCYMPSYKIADNIAHKALMSPNCSENFSIMIHTNMTGRLLRANYSPKTLTEQIEINKLFAHYMGVAKAAWAQYPDRAFNIVFEIRQALFDGNCKAITAGLEKLKATGKKNWYKVTRGEVLEHLSSLQDKLTTPLRRLLTGHRIQLRREELGMTTNELAQLVETEQMVINQIERGATGASPTRLHIIARALQTDFHYLSGNEKKVVAFDGDIIVHNITQALRNATEHEKQFVLDMTRAYLKNQKHIVKDK